VKGEHYYFIPGFLKHQKIQHPLPAKNPAPPRQACDLFTSGSRPAHEQTEAQAETEAAREPVRPFVLQELKAAPPPFTDPKR
jgi:hypothetical protein